MTYLYRPAPKKINNLLHADQHQRTENWIYSNNPQNTPKTLEFITDVQTSPAIWRRRNAEFLCAEFLDVPFGALIPLRAAILVPAPSWPCQVSQQSPGLAAQVNADFKKSFPHHRDRLGGGERVNEL